MNSSKSIGNIVFNYGSKFFSLISVFVFIPLYIKYVGIESYAVIGFYGLLLGIVSFADAGLSSAVIKEFASAESTSYKFSILRLIEKRYIFICFILMLIIVFFAPLIAENWLTSETIPIEKLSYYIRLIGIGISLQLLSSLYFGSLFGMGFQIEANMLQIIWNMFKSFLVILPLIFIESNLEVFFLWQIACNLIFVVILRWRTIKQLEKVGPKLTQILNKIPKPIIQYVSGMVLIALMSSINSQADKVVTSSVFPLKLYAYYTLASTVAQIPVMLAVPMSISLFPVISRFVSRGQKTELKILFEKSTFILNNIIFVAVFALIFYTKEVILLWTGSSIETTSLSEVLLTTKLLVIGSALLALQFLLYYVLLSFNKTKYNVMQGIFQIGLGIPILYFFIFKIGMAGGGISWIAINGGGLIFLFLIVTTHFVKVQRFGFVFKNYFVPFMISLAVFFCVYFGYQSFSLNFIITAFLSCLISILLNVIYYNFRNHRSWFDYKNIINLYAQ